jgi:hypothetical protein
MGVVQSEKLRFRKGDWLAIGAVVLLAAAVLLCFFPGSKTPASSAEIYLDGKLIKTVDLAVDQTFTVSGRYTNVITVEAGNIFVAEADCPGEDCVHSGRISTLGRILVCLPNGLEIRITSAKADVDFVVG